MTGTDSLTWWLPRLPTPHNRALRAHWSARRRDRRAWGLLVRAVSGWPAEPVRERVHLRITVRRARRQDPDNAAASVKPLLDALVSAGWLRDDSPRWLELDVREAVEREPRRRGVAIEWRRAEVASGALAAGRREP